jgi:hypothetical protein
MKNLFVLALTIFLHGIQVQAQSQLRLEIKTGGDDLRGGGDNADLILNLHSGQKIEFKNINRSRNWHNNYTNIQFIDLSPTVRPEDIASITMKLAFDGTTRAMNRDNWNVDKLDVNHTYTVNGLATTYRLYSGQGAPLFRLEAPDEKNREKNKKELAVTPVRLYDNRPATSATMRAIFRTGGDDLRGGGDNLNLTLILRNTTRTVQFDNINSGRNWGNDTDKQVRKELPSEVSFDDIESVKLEHTGGGGMGADNWNLDQFTIYITVGGTEQLLITKRGNPLPLQRFTGDFRRKTYRVERN